MVVFLLCLVVSQLFMYYLFKQVSLFREASGGIQRGAQKREGVTDWALVHSNIKVVLESNPPRSRVSVRRLAVQFLFVGKLLLQIPPTLCLPWAVTFIPMSMPKTVCTTTSFFFCN